MNYCRLTLQLLIAGAAAVSMTACERSASAAITRSAPDSVHQDSIARARQDSINRTSRGYVVDSVHPIDEEIRRFKFRIGGAAVRALEHASASREVLVKRIIQDLAKGDTLDLALAAVTPREFIDLVYPSSPYTHAPYRESPAVVWMEIANPSAAGFNRLIRRTAGKPFAYESHRCNPKAERQGRNSLWVNCSIRVTLPSHETTTQRWFGTILERDGRYKVLSYQNQY